MPRAPPHQLTEEEERRMKPNEPVRVRLEGLGNMKEMNVISALRKAKISWRAGSLIFRKPRPDGSSEIGLATLELARKSRNAAARARMSALPVERSDMPALCGPWSFVRVTLDTDPEWVADEDVDLSNYFVERDERRYEVLRSASQLNEGDQVGGDPAGALSVLGWSPTFDWEQSRAMQNSRLSQRLGFVANLYNQELLPEEDQEVGRATLRSAADAQYRKRKLPSTKQGAKFLALADPAHVAAAAAASKAVLEMELLGSVFALRTAKMDRKVCDRVKAAVLQQESLPSIPWLQSADPASFALTFLVGWTAFSSSAIQVQEYRTLFADLDAAGHQGRVFPPAETERLLRSLPRHHVFEQEIAFFGLSTVQLLIGSAVFSVRKARPQFADHLIRDKAPMPRKCLKCVTELRAVAVETGLDFVVLPFAQTLRNAVLLAQSSERLRQLGPCPNALCRAELFGFWNRLTGLKKTILIFLEKPLDLTRKAVSVPLHMRPSRHGFALAAEKTPEAANSVFYLSSFMLTDGQADVVYGTRGINDDFWTVFARGLRPFQTSSNVMKGFLASPSSCVFVPHYLERLGAPAPPDGQHEGWSGLHFSVLLYERAEGTELTGIPLSVGAPPEGLTRLAFHGSSPDNPTQLYSVQGRMEVVKSSLAGTPTNWAEVDIFDCLRDAPPSILHPLRVLYRPSLDSRLDRIYLFMKGYPGTANELVPQVPNPATDQVLAWANAYKVLKGLASAVAYLHKIGVVNLDLKLPNVLVTAQGEAVLTDMGTAMVLGKGGFVMTEASGTPGYRPLELIAPATPEHVLPKLFCAGTPADVFALGVCAFRLLGGGYYPYDSKTLDQDVGTRFTKMETYVKSGRIVWRPLLGGLSARARQVLGLALRPQQATRPTLERFRQCVVDSLPKV